MACLALSRFAKLLLTIVRTFAHMCGVAAVLSLDSPVLEPFLHDTVVFFSVFPAVLLRWYP